MKVKYATMRSTGRRVVACWCNGQVLHEHKPHGGGTMIFACPPEPFYPPKGSVARKAAREVQSQDTVPEPLPLDWPGYDC